MRRCFRSSLSAAAYKKVNHMEGWGLTFTGENTTMEVLCVFLSNCVCTFWCAPSCCRMASVLRLDGMTGPNTLWFRLKDEPSTRSQVSWWENCSCTSAAAMNKVSQCDVWGGGYIWVLALFWFLSWFWLNCSLGCNSSTNTCVCV